MEQIFAGRPIDGAQDKPAGQAEGVKFLRMENGAAAYAVGSGAYRFQSALPKTVK